MSKIEIIDYTPSYGEDFRKLNEAWIVKFFELEKEDVDTLKDPDKIIRDGGFIFIALKNLEAVGVCALRKFDNDTFEFSKMAVSENNQGEGIGRKLANAAIEKAKLIGANRIFLEGNTSLEASIRLYHKVGFKEMEVQQSHYKRVNIMMEMFL